MTSTPGQQQMVWQKSKKAARLRRKP